MIGFPEGNLRDSADGVQQVAQFLTVEGLTFLSKDGRAEPRMAESWSWHNDGLQLRVRLRDNIKLHDGTALTAAMVADALKKAVPVRDNRAQYWSFGAIQEIYPAGDKEIVVDLTRPAGELPEDLQLPLSFGDATNGTGPYKVVTNDSKGVVLERFVSYYAGTPGIAQVQIRPYDTLRTAWASLLRGDIDVVTNVPADVLEFVGNEQIAVTSFLRWYEYVITFNSAKPPFSVPAVRRALNLAINRGELISKVLKGKGLPATGPLWPQHWAYDSSVQPYVFDPEAAEALLDSVGMRRRRSTTRPSDTRELRFSFTCLAPANFSIDERIGLQVQKQLYDIGVDMQFETVPAAEYGSRITRGDFDAVLINLISGPTLGRPYMFWGSARSEGGAALGKG